MEVGLFGEAFEADKFQAFEHGSTSAAGLAE
jgi:hypothetical protein